VSERELGLSPGSPAPASAAERDRLLRRVPEVALVPELRALRFPADRVLGGPTANHVGRLAELADGAYLARLRSALAGVEKRADDERNGGLRFLATSLGHFVAALPPERHPLIVALYFASAFDEPERHFDEVAELMDAYESALPALAGENSHTHR
jgi:hypothetical protein